MKTYYYWILAFSATIFIMACAESKTTTEAPAIPGIDVTLMDTTTAPQNDFFRYVNGKWMDETEIPADRGRWGSFDELRKKSSENVLEVLNKAIDSKSYGAETDQYKAATFYATAMDTASINKEGLNPLKAYIDQINAIKTLEDIQKYNEATIYVGGRGFFDFSVFPDLRNSTVNAAYLSSGSIGLPDRDYYVKGDEESKEIRAKYLDHIVNMMSYLGVSEGDARPRAEKVLALETKLAEPMMTKVQRRNPLLMYNKRSMEDLAGISGAFDWKGFLKNIGAGYMDTILVIEPKYMKAMNDIVNSTDISVLKDYLLWNELNNAASYLSTDIERTNFDFYGKTLRGTEQMRPRWERILDVSSGVVGEAIGKLYVDEYFPPEAKQKAADMVENITAAFGDRIQNLKWMTDETKEKAMEKLSSFTVKIGYPDKWKDYSSMDIKSVEDGGSYATNMVAAAKWGFDEQLEKLGKEVDKTEWGMSPQTVNAYYNPLNNEIVFPAAILQPPFYNYQADEAVNYGGIGGVIGHEISHGFDDQGSRFDATGNMSNWWSETDQEQFEARNQVLIDQFDAYEPLPGVNVDGKFTLGENIGDLGGINAAYDGLQRHLTAEGRPDDIDGFTAEQRFFLSWATIWRGKMRDEALKNRIKTDPHSPSQYRAVGPLSNLPAFYQAFDVKEGDAMYRADSLRVDIW